MTGNYVINVLNMCSGIATGEECFRAMCYSYGRFFRPCDSVTGVHLYVFYSHTDIHIHTWPRCDPEVFVYVCL